MKTEKECIYENESAASTAKGVYEKLIHESKPMSYDEEMAHWKLVQNGDQRAFDKIVESNLRFMAMQARPYIWTYNLPYEEVMAEGCLALVQAARKFDPSRGYRLVSFASAYIAGAFKTMLAKYIDRGAEDSYDTDKKKKALLVPAPSCYRADYNISRVKLESDICRYIDKSYYPGASQSFMKIAELLIAGYSLREAASKSNIPLSFAESMRAEVKAMLGGRYHPAA